MIYLRSALYHLGFVFGMLVFGIFALLVGRWLPYPLRFHVVTSINFFFLWWLRVTCGLSYEVEGKEYLKTPGGYVLIANHQSEWETFALQVLIRPVCTVMKKELLRIPLFGWGLALLKPIAIDRSERSAALKQILKQGKARLQEGIPVVIFPQGTRVPVGKMGRFNKGGAMLACAAKAPVITLAHNGGELWPSKSWLRHPGVIKVIVRPPIDTVGKSADEVHALATEQLQADMSAVSGLVKSVH